MKFTLCSTRKLVLRLLAFLLGWTALLLGTLQLLHVPMPPLHSLCAGWG